jgi:hypothetical protein
LKVRGVKMKFKKKKKTLFAIKKTYFLHCSFWAGPLPLHFKNDL